jgi:hypothetical protein
MKKKIAISIIVLLVVLRIALPYVVKAYVNKTLQNMESYTGHVDDIDLALYRGAYVIKDLNIFKINGEKKLPFISIKKTDLSIQWKSVFKGSIVGEVICLNPVVNFAFANSDTKSQDGTEEDWTNLIKELLPIKINRFEVAKGTVNLINGISEPSTDVKFTNFNATIENIRNVIDKNVKLPSPVRATADLEGLGGNMVLNANMQLLKEIPDLEYDLKILDMEAVKLNPMAEYYGDINFEKGKISLVSELAIKDQQILGYFKPIGNVVKVFKFKEDEKRSPKRYVKELGVEIGKIALTNFKKNQVASRIPIKGNIDKVQTSFWPIFFSSLSNAYRKAFLKKVEAKTFFTELE